MCVVGRGELYLTSSESREDFDANLLGLLTEPLDIVAERDNIVSGVGHLGRVGQWDSIVLGEKLHVVLQSRLVQRGL
jgi:hypothetical protein